MLRRLGPARRELVPPAARLGWRRISVRRKVLKGQGPVRSKKLDAYDNFEQYIPWSRVPIAFLDRPSQIGTVLEILFSKLHFLLIFSICISMCYIFERSALLFRI